MNATAPRHIVPWAALAVALAAIAGCNGMDIPGPWGGASDDAPPVAGASAGETDDGTRVALPKWRPTRAGKDEPREGYSIWLTKAIGHDHAARAQRAARGAAQAGDLPDVFTAELPGGNGTAVYCGHFDSPEKAEAFAAKIRKWSNAQGARPFYLAHVVGDPREKPGKSKWSLLNAPEDAVYSLAVEEYHNDPTQDFHSRKHVAANRCAELRQQGLEAYYIHMPAKSYVALGLYDGKAITEVREGPLTRKQIADPRLRQAIRSHPTLYINGNVVEVSVPDMKAGQGRMATRPSLPFRIPGRGADDDSETHRVGYPQYR